MRRNGMIDRYDAPDGYVAVNGVQKTCVDCACDRGMVDCSVIHRCLSSLRKDKEQVIFKTRSDFEAVLLQELEQFYRIKITKPGGKVVGLTFYTVENPSQRIKT
jgi:hypothetical protein